MISTHGKAGGCFWCVRRLLDIWPVSKLCIPLSPTGTTEHLTLYTAPEGGSEAVVRDRNTAKSFDISNRGEFRRMIRTKCRSGLLSPTLGLRGSWELQSRRSRGRVENRPGAVLGYIISGCPSGNDRATHRNHTGDGDRNPGVRVWN